MQRLTGNVQTDLLVMQNLSDKDLGYFCRTNTYTRDLCRNDDFWMNRTLKKFSILGPDLLRETKEKYFESWRLYYIDLVNYLFYKYSDNLHALIRTLHSERKDYRLIDEIFIVQTKKLSNLSNIEYELKNNEFANPNAFFIEDYTGRHVYDDDFLYIYAKNKDLVKILNTVKNDERLILELVLSDIFDRKLGKDKTLELLRIIYDAFTVKDLRNVLKLAISKGDRLPIFYLDVLKDKGATREDFEYILDIDPENRYRRGDDDYETQRRALNDIRKFMDTNYPLRRDK